MFVQNMPTMGWTCFPSIHDVTYLFSGLHKDMIVVLLKYNISKQMAVVNKIQYFLGKIRHKIIVDMVHIHRQSQLADLRYNKDLPI